MSVKLDFVGINPAKRAVYSDGRQNPYKYEEVDDFFLEITIDGHRFRVDVGPIRQPDGSKRMGMHINYLPFEVVVDKHSLNAVSLLIPPST